MSPELRNLKAALWFLFGLSVANTALVVVALPWWMGAIAATLTAFYAVAAIVITEANK